MNTPPNPAWIATTAKVPASVPKLDGSGIAETFEMEVFVWEDTETGEITVPVESLEMISRAVTRRMGLLTPEELKELRESLELTQAEISNLLQIGEKTWTRWETGKERQSHSKNLLILLVREGILNRYQLNEFRMVREQAISRQLALPAMAASNAAILEQSDSEAEEHMNPCRAPPAGGLLAAALGCLLQFNYRLIHSNSALR